MSHNPASTDSIQSGLALRLQALELLKKAQEIDGLLPFMGLFDRSSQQDEQFIWAESAPTGEELRVVFSDVFELSPGGTLSAFAFHDLDVLCGVAPEARLGDILFASSS